MADVTVAVQAARPAVLAWARAAAHPLRVELEIAGPADSGGAATRWTVLDCPVDGDVLTDGTRWRELVTEVRTALAAPVVAVHVPDSEDERPLLHVPPSAATDPAAEIALPVPTLSEWAGDLRQVAERLGRPGAGPALAAALDRAAGVQASGPNAGRPGRPGDLAERWRGALEQLAAALGVPDVVLGVPAPGTRQLMVIPTESRYLLGGLARAVGLDLWSLPVADRVLVASAEPQDDLDPVVAGLAAGRATAVAVKRAGDGCAATVVRGTRLLLDTWWGRPTDVVGADSVLPKHAWVWDGSGFGMEPDAVEILAALGLPKDDASLLRALLRRTQDPAGRVLPELVTRLGLPPVAADLMLGERWLPEVAGAEPVEPAGFWETVRLAREDAAEHGGRLRKIAARRPWWYRLIDLVAVALLAGIAYRAVDRALAPDGSPWWWLWAALAALVACWSAVDAVLPGARHRSPASLPPRGGG